MASLGPWSSLKCSVIQYSILDTCQMYTQGVAMSSGLSFLLFQGSFYLSVLFL